MFEKPFKTIVVGVDFSPYSKIVVRQAKLLCHMWDSKLVLVHAIQDAFDYSDYPFMFFPNTISNDEYITKMRKFYEINNFSTKMYAEFNSPSKLLIETAKKFPRSLIMVGHRGHNMLDDLFFGSTSQKVAMESKLPVWIHRGNKTVKPNRYLVPHDLSQPSSHSLKLIKKISLAEPVYYEVFFVNQKPLPILDYETYQKMNRQKLKKVRSGIKNLFKHYPHVPFVSSTGDITNKLVKRSNDFDVLLMTHHNPSGFLKKSETEILMKKVHVPILVTH